MFFGTYNHQVDDKGRIRIPTKFKHELGDNPFIMQGAEKCLYVYPRERADEMFKASFADGRFDDKKLNAQKAKIMSKACFAEEDKQGRVPLPQALLKYAGIACSSSIVSIGAYDHVQIWDKEAWDRFNVENDEEAEEQN